MAPRRKGKKGGKSSMYTTRGKKGAGHQPWTALGAWFLGPKAENGELFQGLVESSVHSQIKFRQKYFPCDPIYVTDEVKASESYKKTIDYMKKQVKLMQDQMERSVPFFSSRYKGHVLWDTVMPANLGYMTALLYNQNNCAQEASVVTTDYEVEVGTHLCEMLGYDPKTSMGHLVTGGSIANIEAMWVARNMKFFPLGLQDAVQNVPKLATAKSYPVFIPELNKKIPLETATQWQLLNLDIDTIITMPEDVALQAGIEQSELIQIMGGYAYEAIGTQEFTRRHDLKTNPCILAGSTCHVSFTKAVTILGIGKEHLVTVPVDKHARVMIDELRKMLERKLVLKIPVIAVVAIMGTTEESAVDSLTDIEKLRSEIRVKGLNFALHGDGAWGGYFASMVREPPPDFYMGVERDNSGFVPELMLSRHVHKQISSFHLCDTITIDPHKSGFCPYPAGATCYRDQRMNTFLNITGQVTYYHGDVNLGDVGLEGSKPGAAAAGVMLAHRVIGLHKNGYGRILAECTFTAKLLYCAWVTIPQPQDNFIVVPTQPFPPGETQKYIRFMEQRILSKSNEELVQDDEAMEFLREIGPDTLIPCFSVNIKGNQNVDICNQINDVLFKDLVHTDAHMTARRTPIIVTSSTMQDHKHSNALTSFKERLGLNLSDKSGVQYIITTCMDPWSTSLDFVDDLANIMRNAILCAIGQVNDVNDYHAFVSTGFVNNADEVIVDYAGDFQHIQHQYFTMAKLRFLKNSDAKEFRRKAQELQKASPNPPPLVFRNQEADKLHDVLIYDPEEGEGGRNKRKEMFDVFVGVPHARSKPFMSANTRVVDLPRFDHFDPIVSEYPEFSTYFMYGHKHHAYIAHIPTKKPDFQQLVELQDIPDGVSALILQQGIEVQLLEVSGTPKIDGSGNVVNPLTHSVYKITFIGVDGEEQESTMKLGRFVWFDGTLG